MSLWEDFFNERNFPCLLWDWQYGGDFLFLVEEYFLAGAIICWFWSLPNSWLGQQEWQRLFGEVQGDRGVPNQPELGHSTRGSSWDQQVSRRIGTIHGQNRCLSSIGLALPDRDTNWVMFSDMTSTCQSFSSRKTPSNFKRFLFLFLNRGEEVC